MNRVTVRRFLYVVTLCSLALLVGIALGLGGFSEPLRMLAFAVPATALVVRVAGRQLIDNLVASRAYLAIGEHQKAIAAADHFLEELEQQPWRRHAVWTLFGVYTLSFEAMALNNRGGARFELGQLEQAAEDLLSALEVDPEYCLPHLNLGLVAHASGDDEAASEYFRIARSLGLPGSIIKKTIAKLEDRTRPLTREQ